MRRYVDRNDAAGQLLRWLPEDIDARWIVLALPRGGVPIGAALADHMGAPLDIITVRKVGAPGNPELALAAATGPRDQDILINREVQRMSGLTEAETLELGREVGRGLAARRRDWIGDREPPDLAGCRVLIVDDGAATGTTLAAAVDAVQRLGAREVAVALPVALQGALRKIPASIRVICPLRDAGLPAVGAAYDRFDQVSDAEVRALLDSNSFAGTAPARPG
ncbi:MAG: phosphoribosyltransferase [Pseudooceanicola sp.]